VSLEFKNSLFLATGNKNGVYYALGLRIKKALERADPDIEVVVLQTEGSIENARLIETGVDLALIQNDVAHYFRNGERVFRFPSDEMQGVISLYTEFVHVLARRSLLSDEDSPDPDAKSALIALAICKLCERNPHIVAEAQNHRKLEHLKDAGVDEVICSGDLGLGVLAQCALHAKLSTVYDQLLTYGDDTNEIYVVAGSKLPDWLVGHTFEEVGEIMKTGDAPLFCQHSYCPFTSKQNRVSW